MANPRLRVISSNDYTGDVETASSPESGITQHVASDNTTGKPSIGRDHQENRNQLAEFDLEQLYPASAELNTSLSKVLILLSQCLQRVDRAIDYYRNGDAILADDQTHHLLVLLDELFCLREISEGFASVVNGCTNAIRNMHGEPIQEDGLLALNSCLLALKKKPLISFDDSLELVERLENADLNTDVSGTEHLIDWLSDESTG